MNTIRLVVEHPNQKPRAYNWFAEVDFPIEGEYEKIEITPTHHILRKKQDVLFKSAPVQFMFLYHVKNIEYDIARTLLSFKISDQGLENFFGTFEILLNNYLNNPNKVTILQNGVPKTLTFEIQNNVIQNIA